MPQVIAVQIARSGKENETPPFHPAFGVISGQATRKNQQDKADCRSIRREYLRKKRLGL
jgi:hypothetical protein